MHKWKTNVKLNMILINDDDDDDNNDEVAVSRSVKRAAKL